jgi:hypothetical protein
MGVVTTWSFRGIEEEEREDKCDSASGGIESTWMEGGANDWDVARGRDSRESVSERTDKRSDPEDAAAE